MLDSLAMVGPETALIVLVLVLVLFGGSKIPQLMRGVGQGMGELRKGMEEGQRQLSQAMHSEPEPRAPEAAPQTTPAPATTTTPSGPAT